MAFVHRYTYMIFWHQVAATMQVRVSAEFPFVTFLSEGIFWSIFGGSRFISVHFNFTRDFPDKKVWLLGTTDCSWTACDILFGGSQFSSDPVVKDGGHPVHPTKIGLSLPLGLRAQMTIARNNLLSIKKFHFFHNFSLTQRICILDYGKRANKNFFSTSIYRDFLEWRFSSHRPDRRVVRWYRFVIGKKNMCKKKFQKLGHHGRLQNCSDTLFSHVTSASSGQQSRRPRFCFSYILSNSFHRCLVGFFLFFYPSISSRWVRVDGGRILRGGGIVNRCVYMAVEASARIVEYRYQLQHQNHTRASIYT